MPSFFFHCCPKSCLKDPGDCNLDKRRWDGGSGRGPCSPSQPNNRHACFKLDQGLVGTFVFQLGGGGGGGELSVYPSGSDD